MMSTREFQKTKSSKSKGITDLFEEVKVIMTGVGLKTPLDYEEEKQA